MEYSKRPRASRRGGRQSHPNFAALALVQCSMSALIKRYVCWGGNRSEMLERFRPSTITVVTNCCCASKMLGSFSHCTSCHILDANRCNVEYFESLSGTNFFSNFLPIQKNQRASCHRQSGAPAGCAACHNYHVGSPISKADSFSNSADTHVTVFD